MEGRVFKSWQEQDFSVLSNVQTGSEAHPAFYSMVESGRSFKLTTPSSVEVKNGGAILPLPDTSSWRGA
jgi:hypothetical protein